MGLPKRCLGLWDLITCPLPENAVWDEPDDILSNIESAVVDHSPAGFVIFEVYGDDFPDPIEKLYPSIRMMLSHPGFSRWFFRSVDINADLLVQSLEPMRKKSCGGQNLFIITGEKVVLSFLKRLHRNDCNILVALPDGCSADLVPFASCVWHLSSLLNGKPPFLVRENMVPWRAKDCMSDLTNQDGKKFPGNGFKSSIKSCHKEARVVSKPNGKQGYSPKQTALGSEQAKRNHNSKVVPNKIGNPDTRLPGGRPISKGSKGTVLVSSNIRSANPKTHGGKQVNLIGSPREQSKSRCSPIARKPALVEVSQGAKENIESHNSPKKISKGLGGRLMNPIGRLRDQSSEGCSQSVKKLALEINQSSKVVPSKVGNANTRRSQGGSRLMNPIGGSRAESCSPSVKKQDLKQIWVRSLGENLVVDKLKDPSPTSV
ncbi:hypothetical protein OROMI_008209 [Orobanche minor]